MLADRNPSRRLWSALAVAGSLSLAGCAAAPDRLYISSTTLLGLDASVNTARTAGHVQFGYDRYFVTWVPQSVKDGDGHEVMSALNCTHVVVGGLMLKKFEESLATGKAALNFANAVDGDSEFFDCFRPATPQK
jgi:hypothetical protein